MPTCTHLNPEPQSPKETFWETWPLWRRAGTNTFYCLIGCSIGDYSMLFYLTVFHPEIPVVFTMALAMASGLMTSLALETVILRVRESFTWRRALKTSLSMSLTSMLGMELAANVTDYLLTGGVVDPSAVWFWVALSLSLLAGFVAPLPYNYYMLKKYGRDCH